MSYPLEDVRPMFELRGRNYVVTGGAQGIGFALTRAICEMGGNVAVMDIQDKPVNTAEWNNLSQKFGAKTFYIRTDVTKQESLNQAFATAIRELGSLDGLIPAAGIAIDKPFVDQTWEEFTRIQEINVSRLASIMKFSVSWPFADTHQSGQRHILCGSTRHKANDIPRQGWQHCSHCIAVKSYRTARVSDGRVQRQQRWRADVGQGTGCGIGAAEDSRQYDISWLRGQ